MSQFNNEIAKFYKKQRKKNTELKFAGIYTDLVICGDDKTTFWKRKCSKK